MCFHGRKSSREAGDSGAAIGATSTTGETEPDVMGDPAKIVTEKPFLLAFIRTILG
jgi:hypothetical protein